MSDTSVPPVNPLIPPKDEPLPYYTAAPVKFVLLSLCSFGLFEFYWFYENWKQIKLSSGEKLSPFWRATLAIFWIFPLFQHIHENAEKENIEHDLHPYILAAGYLLLIVMLFIGLKHPFDLVGVFRCVPMLMMNNVARAYCKAVRPDFKDNSKLGIGGGLLVFFGGIAFMFSTAFKIVNPDAFISKHRDDPAVQQMIEKRFGSNPLLMNERMKELLKK